MANKKYKIIFLILILIVSVIFIQSRMRHTESETEMVKEINLERGNIQNIISTTGTVLPRNRLEVKPPVNGRIDDILVKEGEVVKAGQTLAWMSSTERAALLDAARGQNEEQLKYWKEVYKAIPLISPIDAEVIVATTQPGQTVTTADAVVVLSDSLIVRAQVDETDIGKITLNQKAVISLDAYPDANIKARVEHIYYESKTVNNVTIYEVDLIPDDVPLFFRSGMNATVDFLTQSRENVLLVPQEAVLKEKDADYILVKQGNAGQPVKTMVKLGMSDDKNVEIISGASENDIVVIKGKKYSLPKNTNGKNPFMPSRRR